MNKFRKRFYYYLSINILLLHIVVVNSSWISVQAITTAKKATSASKASTASKANTADKADVADKANTTKEKETDNNEEPAPTPVPENGGNQEQPAPSITPEPSAETQDPSPTQSPEDTSSPTPTPAPTSSPSQNQESNESTPTSEPSPTTQSDPGDVKIKTGDASNTGTIITEANHNTSVSPSNDSDGVVVANAGNGSSSDNSTSLTTDNESITVQDNTAVVDNGLELGTSTGTNVGSDNVGNTSIKSGDANTTGTILNSVNTNIDGVAIAEFNVVDDHIGDIILDFSDNCVAGCDQPVTAINAENGSDSNNNIDVNQLNDEISFQTNNADLNNSMNLFSDSGSNLANDNTAGDTAIYTGDANVSANVVNMANNNFTGDVIYSAVNIFGDLIGDIIFPEEAMEYFANSGNGSGSSNEINQTEINDTIIFQENLTDINNNIELSTTTGDNSTSANTGGEVDIDTGDTSADVQVTNVAGMNVVGDMWMVLVNSAGNWVGKILGADPEADMAGSEGIEFVVNDNGDVTVTNTGNGSDSTNIGNIYESNETTIVQSNTANINNEIVLDANSGGNSASRNTGGDVDIKTGDANVIANIVNFVNNNIVGDGRLFVNMVNVFGSWMGDFVSPEAEAERIARQQQQEQQDQQSQEQAQSNTSSPSPNSDPSPAQHQNQDQQAAAPEIGGPIASQQYQYQEVEQEQVGDPSPTPSFESSEGDIDYVATTQSDDYTPPTLTQTTVKPISPLTPYLRMIRSKLGLAEEKPKVKGIQVGTGNGSSSSLGGVFASANKDKDSAKTNINLAWLFVIIPPFMVYYWTKRKYSQQD